MNKYKTLVKNLAKLDFNYEKASMYSDRYKENDALHKDILDEIRLASGSVRRDMCKIYDTHSVLATGYSIKWEWFFDESKPEVERLDNFIPWDEFLAGK